MSSGERMRPGEKALSNSVLITAQASDVKQPSQRRGFKPMATRRSSSVKPQAQNSSRESSSIARDVQSPMSGPVVSPENNQASRKENNLPKKDPKSKTKSSLLSDSKQTKSKSQNRGTPAGKKEVEKSETKPSLPQIPQIICADVTFDSSQNDFADFPPINGFSHFQHLNTNNNRSSQENGQDPNDVFQNDSYALPRLPTQSSGRHNQMENKHINFSQTPVKETKSTCSRGSTGSSCRRHGSGSPESTRSRSNSKEKYPGKPFDKQRENDIDTKQDKTKDNDLKKTKSKDNDIRKTKSRENDKRTTQAKGNANKKNYTPASRGQSRCTHHTLSLPPDDEDSDEELRAHRKTEAYIRSLHISPKPADYSRYLREVQQQDDVEVRDSDFESDTEDGVDSKEIRVKDVKTMYNKACKLLKIVTSSRIERELANERVYLDYAGLNTQDVKAACIALLCNTRINRLDLSGNQLSDQAAQYISELVTENVFITNLWCSNCQLREGAVGRVIETVTTNRNLTVLNLSENKLQDEQVELVASLLKKNSVLRELKLSYCDIDEEGGKILAPALAECTVETLDLSWNQLRQKGGTAFCLALGENQSIRDLDLSWNGLGREGCAGLEAALDKNKTLVRLNLECNRIHTLCLTHLLKGLEKNNTLETLLLAKNPLSIEDTKLIVACLRDASNSAIKVLDISDVTVDDEFVTMQESLQSSRGVSIYYGNILNRFKKEIKCGPRTLASFDPILVLFEYMKQQNLRLIDLFRALDVNHDNAISKEELRNGFLSLNMALPEGVFSAAFSKLDLNSNNLIDIDELKSAHRRVIRQTAMMMLRAKSKQKGEEEDNNHGDLLYEFQKLVREAAAKRISRQAKTADDEGAKSSSLRSSLNQKRMSTSARKKSGAPSIYLTPTYDNPASPRRKGSSYDINETRSNLSVVKSKRSRALSISSAGSSGSSKHSRAGSVRSTTSISNKRRS